MRTYTAKRSEQPGGQKVYIEEEEKGIIMFRQLDPRQSQKVWNHSPDGFEWGYAGSGPAQLALAILLDAGSLLNPTLPNERIAAASVRLHQEFKRLYVASFNREGWKLPLGEVDKFVFLRGGWTGHP